MPELPEVETIRRDLAGAVLHQPIIAVHILAKKTAKNSAAFFKVSLIGRKFSEISRRGKLLIFKIGVQVPEKFLLIHLKMTGQLIYAGRQKKIAGGHSLSGKSFSSSVGGDLPHKHTRAWLEFKDGGRLFFNDLRRFGYLKIVSASELAKILENNYGPEPLTKEFSLAALEKICQHKKIKIKALLLNQKLLAGLGNIYADESLWLARINPKRPAGSLKPVEIKKLYEAINKIIAKAVEHRGTTFNNYVDSSGRRGNFSNFLQVYGRGGKACPNCGRALIKEKVAGRGTHYCSACQK